MSQCLCQAGIFCIEKSAVTCTNGNLIVQICHCNPVVSGTSQVSAGWPVCLRGYGFPGWLQYWVTCCFSRHLLTPTPAEWLLLVFPWTACWEGEAILACFERSQVRRTLWMEGLYYSQNGGGDAQRSSDSETGSKH